MAQIFGTLATPTALSLGKHMLTINNGNYKLAVNSLEYNFSRVVTPYYTLNSDDTGRILVTSDPIGTLRLNYIMGASKNLEQFLSDYSNICNIKENIISADIGLDKTCKGNTLDIDNEVFTFDGCLISSVGGNLSRSERGTLCLGRIDLTFINLSVSTNN